MSRNFVFALIILLVIGGLIYWIYPRIPSLAATRLQSSDSSTATAVSPTHTPLASDGPVTITSTPTTENLISVAAQVTAATATTPAVSTHTPTPQFEDIPSVVPPHLTPTDQATADYLDVLATADAFIEGVATPAPPNSPTATPIIPAATGTLTPGPTSIMFVIVTATPTPKNVITVAAQAAAATAVATAVGTYTPIPWNWVVPIVVTPEPATAIPANAATATFQVAEATASALVYGTPTPTPAFVWTATPTPFMRPVIGEVATPWVPPSPTPTPLPIPQELVGKIMFLSNRSGGPQPLSEPLVYVMDPDGGNLAVLTDYTFYNTALARDIYSADQGYRAFVKEPNGVPAILYLDYRDRSERPITTSEFDAGGAWEPAWSPTHEQIAFVSDISGFEEIWIANRDGSGLRQLTAVDVADVASESGKNGFVPEASGHPSWSPDGSKIVFWSTRTGDEQIWVMNADGSNPYLLSPSRYDNWNPVWVKYTDPARESVFGIGELAPNVVD
jgi:hypothetical protein